MGFMPEGLLTPFPERGVALGPLLCPRRPLSQGFQGHSKERLGSTTGEARLAPAPLPSSMRVVGRQTVVQ